MFNKLTWTSAALALALLGLTGSVAQATPSQTSEDTLLKVFQTLQAGHYSQPTEDKLLQAAIDGMIRSLQDPYTEYMTKQEYDAFLSALESSYGGIGVTLDPYAEQGLLVQSLRPGSPAGQAGVQAGDIILTIDGKPAGRGQNANLPLLGPAGTQVNIQVKRGTTTLTFTITRAQIDLPNVEAELRPDGVGVLAIRAFGSDTSREFLVQLDRLQREGAQALVLDLRDNGGGVVSEAATILDKFLGEVPLFYIDAKGEPITIAGDADKVDLPLAVLVNRNTASASEILAGGLQASQRAQLFGTQTFGKDEMQTAELLPDDGLLKYTLETYRLPDGSSIHHKGITPNVRITTAELQTNAAVQSVLPTRQQQLSFTRQPESANLLNGTPVSRGVLLHEADGQLYVPLRYLVEGFGQQVDWSPEAAAVTFRWKEQHVQAHVGKGELTLSPTLSLPGAVRSHLGTTYLSLDAVQQLTGHQPEVTASAVTVYSR